ncbi:MAG: hypothetical protein R2772_02410 [Chitinophagales bacterium]
MPTYNFSQTVSICANDSFLLPGGTYINTAGTYNDNFTSANGCDSTWTTTLNVLLLITLVRQQAFVPTILSYCLRNVYK